VLGRDFERFKRALPADFADHVRDAHRIDLSARYLGCHLSHPIGKGSGQLSLNAGQLEDDAAAGLAFVILKTVMAEDESGAWCTGGRSVQVGKGQQAKDSKNLGG
jgi:hypothetical protein